MRWSVGVYYQEFWWLRSKFNMLMNLKLLDPAIEMSSIFMIRNQNTAIHVLKKISVAEHQHSLSYNFQKFSW
jgi:hypothetical protein